MPVPALVCAAALSAWPGFPALVLAPVSPLPAIIIGIPLTKAVMSASSARIVKSSPSTQDANSSRHACPCPSSEAPTKPEVHGSSIAPARPGCAALVRSADPPPSATLTSNSGCEVELTDGPEARGEATVPVVSTLDMVTPALVPPRAPPLLPLGLPLLKLPLPARVRCKAALSSSMRPFRCPETSLSLAS